MHTERRLSPQIMVYLVRHGRTRLNAQGVLRGHLDVPLDDEGRRQAERLAEAFRQTEIEAVVTSPLVRARETAQFIAATSSAPLTVEPRLVDRDYRQWAGQPESILRERYGTIDVAPGIEPLATFTGRIINALADLADRFRDRRVVVVAHDAVNRQLIGSLVMGADPAAIPQRPGCWNRLERIGSTWTAPIVDAVPDQGPVT